MNEFWRQFQGKTAGDHYTLGEILGAKEESAVYLTESRDGLPAVIKIRHAEPSSEYRHWGDWAASSQLSHPNLIRVFATGMFQIDEYSLEYLVMERAEETLAGVLTERALSEAEAREMLAPALTAIAFLHQNHYLHGKLCPSNVLAVGETLKLSSDNLVHIGDHLSKRDLTAYDAPEAQNSPASALFDSWSLGALLLQSLTLQLPEVKNGEVILPNLNGQFAQIARHTLVVAPERRWNVNQIADAAQGRTVVTPPPPAAPPPPPAKPLAERRVLSPPVPAPERTPAKPQWRIPAIVLSALVLLLLFWFVRKPSGPAAAKVASTPLQTAVSAPPPVVVAPTAQSPKRIAAVPVTKRAPASGAWYVVVATYTGKNDAEKRARAISTRWPKFHAHVFDPPVRDPHHLVVIGANLSEDEAEALRKRARAAGLPQDVYIKKFAR